MAESDPTPARTYEIEQLDGTLERFDIPENWKVTFGPIQGSPGSANEAAQKGSRFRNGYAFRAWEADNKQRILITGVVRFRDLSVPRRVRCVRRYGTEVWFPDDGTWTGTRAAEVEKLWKNADDTDFADEDPQAKAVTLDPNDFDDDGRVFGGPVKRTLKPR